MKRKFKVGQRFEVTLLGNEEGNIIEIAEVDSDLIHYKTIKGKAPYDQSFNLNTMFAKSLKPAKKDCIVIYEKDQEVIALNKATGENAVAKCHPDDKFDFLVGAKIAFDRLVGEAQEVPKYKPGDLFQVKPNLKDFDDVSPGIVGGMLRAAGQILNLIGITDKNYLRLSDDWNYLEKWLNPIKEVKRKAKVGEFVKVVDAENVPDGEYKNGDILKIIDTPLFSSFVRYANGKARDHKERVLNNSEYVVLEGYEDCDQVKKFDEPIKEGDIVEIVNSGNIYSTFCDWMKRNIDDKDLLLRYNYGCCATEHSGPYKVVKIAPHGRDVSDTIALIVPVDEHDERVVMISVNGLKKC